MKQQDQEMEVYNMNISTEDDTVVVGISSGGTKAGGTIPTTGDEGAQPLPSLPDLVLSNDTSDGGDSRGGGMDLCRGVVIDDDDEVDAIFRGEQQGGGDGWTDCDGPDENNPASSGVGSVVVPPVRDDDSMEDIEERQRQLKDVVFTSAKSEPPQDRMICPEGEQQQSAESAACMLDNVDVGTAMGKIAGDTMESVVTRGVERPACAEATLCEMYAFLQDGEEMLSGAAAADRGCVREDDEMSECDGGTDDGSRSRCSVDKSLPGGAPLDLAAFVQDVERRVVLLSKQINQENLLPKEETLQMLQSLEDNIGFLSSAIHKDRAGEDDEGRCPMDMDSDDGSTEGDYLIPRVQALAGIVHRLLQSLRPVDLDRLIDLLRANSDAGDAIDGGDVLLLIGSTGSGKTTTLHFLAGSSFEEVEVDGFDHLRPVTTRHEHLSGFATSRSTRSVTRTMQSVEVCMEDGVDAHRRVVLCDSPGFDDTDGVEMDIANGLGLVRSIRRARSVKPVLVLSKEGVGDRFQGVSRVLSTVARLVGSSTDNKGPDLGPFEYVFTKYDVKYAKRLHKQFRMKRKEMTSSEKANKALVAFVDDMISTLQPEAHIVAPLQDPDHDGLLRNLMDRNSLCIKDPAKVFVPFVSEMAQDKLQLQLRITLDQCEKALMNGDITSTLYRLQQLKSLAAVLPEAQEFASSATSLCQHCVKERRSSFNMTVERCFLLRANEEAFSKELLSSKGDLETILLLEPLRAECLPSLNSGVDFCCGALLGLGQKLCQGIVDAHQERHPLQQTIPQCKHYVEAVLRTKDVCYVFSELLPSTSNSNVGGIESLYQRACEILNYLVEEVAAQAEGRVDIFPKTPLAEFASEIGCISYILRELNGHHSTAFRLGGFESRRSKMLIAFDGNVKQSVAKSNDDFKRCKHASCLSQLVRVDLRAADLAIELLDGLRHCPELVAFLPTIDVQNLENDIEQFEDTVVDYLSLLGRRYQQEYNSIRNSIEGDSESTDSLVHVAPEVMSVFGHFRGRSHGISKRSDSDFQKVVYVNTMFSNYLASLDSEPPESKQNALSNAERLLRRLKEGDFVAVVPSIAEEWGEWSAILARSQKKPKAGRLQKFFNATVAWTGWGSTEDVPAEKDTLAVRLRKLCAQIIQQIRSEVGSSLLRLRSITSNSCDFTRLFMDHVQDVWTLTVLIALREKEPDLAKSVLDSFCQERGCTTERFSIKTSLTALVDFFQQVSLTWTNHLDQDSFGQMKLFLVAMRDSADFWSHTNDFANQVLKRKRGTEMLQLRESIFACKPYQVLHDEMMSRLFHLQSNTCEVSFLHNQCAQSMNESDRNIFYKEVAQSYKATRHVHHLVGHVDAQVLDTASMRKEASRHLRSETELLSKEMHRLLKNFPSDENGYGRLSLLYCSLQSIESCLSGAAPDIAGLATCLLSDVEGYLNQRFKLMLNHESNTNSCDTVIPLVLTLKKASMELVCWRNALNRLIDQLLLKSSKKALNSGRFLLSLNLQLKNVEGADASVAQQLLCEHDCFRGAMNAVFNSATARQDIDYVIQGLTTLPKAMHIILKTMYESFTEEYESLVVEGLAALSCEEEDSAESFFADLVNSVTEISQDYSLDYRTQLTDLTAHVFAYWSLRNADAFVYATGNLRNDAGLPEEVNGYLMKPHAAQVVAIWTLLNYQHEDYLKLNNHLIQILTGEGKSIVLGVSSTVLALLGCDVECVCYSSYLSSRDFSAFEHMFKDFNVIKYINYGTIDDLCNRILDEGGNLRDLTKDLALGKVKHNYDARHHDIRNRERARVLLVDEVDVFFKDDFYGHSYHPVSCIRHEAISALMRYIWKHRAQLNHQSLMQRVEVNDCLCLFPQEMQQLVSHEIKLMLQDSYGAETTPYSVVEGKIGYKHMDGLTFSTLYGYTTSFAYMLEYEKGKVTLQQMNKNMYIKLNCGRVSYAEIPSIFDYIVGVTGSLQGLSEKELNILRGYNIKDFTFLPSVYGNNKLRFAKDSPQDVILCDTRLDHFMEIRNEINNRRKPEKERGIPRPIMVFFASSQILLEFYNSEHMQDLKRNTRTITEDIREQDKEGAFLRATLSGATTFLIREYGRGTDFKCFDDQVVNSGGVHVIQTFFSSELSEEVQIKGRTARQGTKGSYSMVLNCEDLSKDFDLTMDDVQKMRDTSTFSSFLGPIRDEKYHKACGHREKNVLKAEKLHYDTLNYKKDLLDGNTDKAIFFLYRENGLEHVASSVRDFLPSSHHTKAAFVSAREKRWKELEFDERFRRRAARDEQEKNILKLESSAQRTYYVLLGVEHVASSKEIQQAFRKMSRKYHPDKCKRSGSAERFKELNEAKEILLCPKQRAAYDQMLKRQAKKSSTPDTKDKTD